MKKQIKKCVMLLLTACVFALFFNACERADYQHPLYRKQYEQNKKK